MRWRRPATGLLGVVTAVSLVAGCGSHSSADHAPPFQANPSRASLVAAADLAPCPSSTGSGGDLPDLTLSCLGKGPAVHLTGLSGKPTVVNIWGSWCKDCQKEATYLDSAYDSDRKVVRFLGVDTADSDAGALSYAAEGVTPPMRYPSVVDTDNETLHGLDFPGPPLTLFMSAQGRIVGRHGGPYSSTAQLQHDISTYLHVTT